jgi:hypothetical protein
MASDTGVFVLDADMVLLDLVDGFVRWMLETRDIAPACPFEMETLWNMPTMYPGVDVTSHLASFIGTPDRFARLRFLPGAVEGVVSLRRLLPSFRLICVTSCGDHGAVRQARLDNLAPLCLDEVVTLPFQGCKASTFADLPGGSWVVDDAAHNVEAAAAAGHRAVLFEHGYNRSYPWRDRVSSWPGLVDLVAASVPFAGAA